MKVLAEYIIPPSINQSTSHRLLLTNLQLNRSFHHQSSLTTNKEVLKEWASCNSTVTYSIIGLEGMYAHGHLHVGLCISN